MEEGTKKIQTVRDYYMVPLVKSFGFLNKHHLDNFKHKGVIRSPKRIIRQDKMLPIDAMEIDVLCVNCYECIKVEDVDSHSI